MAKRKRQYTIRDVPEPLDALLREKARRQGKSLNAVALEALGAGAGVQARYDDLDWFFASWTADKAVDEALAAQRRVDKDLWK